MKYIPIEYHDFFKSIKHDQVLDQDFALASYDSDADDFNSDEEN